METRGIHTHTARRARSSACVRHQTLPNTSRAPGVPPRTGGRISVWGALPFLAEKRIVLASAGSWHQPGGAEQRSRHEGEGYLVEGEGP